MNLNLTKAAQAFAIDAEMVGDPNVIKPAFARPKKTTYDALPYRLDTCVDRNGVGAASTLYPVYAVAVMHTGKVCPFRQFAIGGLLAR